MNDKQQAVFNLNTQLFAFSEKKVTERWNQSYVSVSEFACREVGCELRILFFVNFKELLGLKT